MKKQLLCLLLLPLFLSAQTPDYSRYYNSWRLGLNIGAAWQTADMKSKAGLGGGLTLEKGLFENETNFFSLAIRGRYLAANTYGIGHARNYSIAGNDALNGKYDPTVNFLDSVPAGRRYVYDNYKMTLGEGALELQISFNRLRARTHVLLNLWGGVGFTSYRTKTNLKDANGKMYDFSQIDSTGGKAATLRSLKSMYDKTYESDAYGSKGGNTVTFSPSCGIGLGYQFSPGFSLLFEYKLTFPQGSSADLLDGKISPNKDWVAGSKDYYHYAAVNFLFTLRPKKRVKDTTTVYQEPQPTYSTTPTNTLVNVPTSSVTPTEPITNVNTPMPPKPIVTFINPAVQNSVVSAPSYQVRAQVLNVDNASQIEVKLNAFNKPQFSFDPQTHQVVFSINLQDGINSVKIKGTNAAGSDSKTVFIEYKREQLPAGNPPQVVITNPAQSPYTTGNAQFTLQANVMGVASANNIAVLVNGSPTTNFSYNQGTTQLQLPMTLNPGNNQVDIKGSNAFGSDTKAAIIVYQRAAALPPPVITYINPPQDPFTSLAASYAVKAQVLNVMSQSQIMVNLNGQPVSFTYDANLKQVNFMANLALGNNPVTISANNGFGMDTKTTTLILSKQREVNEKQFPPTVTFIVPTTSVSTTNAPVYSFKAAIANVNAKADIDVLLNNAPANFTYNTMTREVFLAPTLVEGANTLSITGRNLYGKDSKSTTVIYVQPDKPKAPPVLTIVQPAAPGTVVGSPAYAFKATVTNITSAAQIAIQLNGTPRSNFGYANGTINFNGALVLGNNNLTITATNADGSDSKTTMVIFRKAETAPTGKPPVVNYVVPSSPLAATTNPVYNIKATVYNVTTQADVTVTHNGNPVGFAFDAATKETSLTLNLVQGDNIVEVKGTNPFGTDTKTVNVMYSPHKRLLLPPTVTITQPDVPNPTVFSTQFTYKATITNISNASQLNVQFNGQPATNFVLSGTDFSFSTPLIPGANVLSITAINNDGTDSKTATVTRKEQAVPKPPTVTITVPDEPNPTVYVGQITFRAVITNIISSTQLYVTLNGTQVTNFSFSGTNFQLSTPIVMGLNTLVIKATNADGTDIKSASVTRKDQTVPKPPIVIITQPSGQATVEVPTYNFAFTTANVQQNQIYLVLNNTTITGFNFNPVDGTGSFQGNLREGNNTFVVTATNADGSESKQAVVVYQPTVYQAPQVQFARPAGGSAKMSDSLYQFKANLQQVSQRGELQVKFNGANVTNYTVNSTFTEITFDATLKQGTNTLEVMANTQGGNASATATVAYRPKAQTPVSNGTPKGSTNLEQQEPQGEKKALPTDSIPKKGGRLNVVKPR